MRWPDGVVARAYIEHVIHVCDLRDVPIQGLVEAGGALCQVRRGKRRGKLRRACGAEAVGWRPCGCAMGQWPGAYFEHVSHVCDLRDVPVQRLVEVGGILSGEERGMLRRAWGAAAAGCRQGGRLACGGAMGQRPWRTKNMFLMSVTCATSQSRCWLKLEAYCQVQRGEGEHCSGARAVQSRQALQARREARVR